jgi:hypothetical protein
VSEIRLFRVGPNEVIDGERYFEKESHYGLKKLQAPVLNGLRAREKRATIAM